MATVCTPKIKRAQSAKSMGFCLRYVMDRKKTEMSNGKALVSGVRCQPELAYQQFMLTKALAGKTEGRMYYHYVQSFKPDENLSPEHAHKIALELADYFQGFEVVVSTHMDRAHLHSHLIINSVSQETGKKLHLDNKSIFRIRDYSDGLCLNHGLSVLKKSEPNYRIKSMSRGEYRASLRGETVKKKISINKKIKVYSSVVDYMKIECKSIKVDSTIRDKTHKSVSSVLFLALRISATQRFNIKNFVAVFVPSNDTKQKHTAHYISNKIGINDIKKTYTVNFSDDLAYQSSIETESKVYIIPLVFSQISNVDLNNFSGVYISFLADDNKIITTELDCRNTAQISGFINQRIMIEEN